MNILIPKSYMGIRDFLITVDNPSTDPNCLVYTNGTC